MGNFLRKVWRAICVFWGIMFAITALGGVYVCFTDFKPENVAAAVFCAVVAFLLLRKRKPKGVNAEPVQAATPCAQVIPRPEDTPVDAYVSSGNMIYRTDGKPIEDREVPYLIDAGLQEALKEQYLSLKISRSGDDLELKSNFFMKYGGASQRKADQFETLARQAYAEKNLDRKIELMAAALMKYKEVQAWHYQKSRGAALWFQDMYERMHNSRNESFSWFDTEKDYLLDLLWERDEARPTILSAAKEGFLQKDIYAQFEPEEKGIIQKMLRDMEAEGLIIRTKKSGTYWVTLT